MQIFFLGDKGTFELFRKAELAILSNTTVGVDDRGRVSLMFTTNAKDFSSSHWVPLSDPITLRFIADYAVSDIKYMNGKPCLIVTENHMTTHVAPYKL